MTKMNTISRMKSGMTDQAVKLIIIVLVAYAIECKARREIK